MMSLIAAVRSWFATRRENDQGAGLAEYGMLLLLVALVAIFSLGALGTVINGLYAPVAAAL